MGFNPESCKNHAAINTIIMAVKKKIYYKERLNTHDPATIRSIIEGRIKTIKGYHCGIQVEGPHLTLGDPPFHS